MTDEKAQGGSADSAPLDYEQIIRAIMNGPEMLRGSAEEGARFIHGALRGFGVRAHFDRCHPDQIERGLEMAPAEAPDREAWLYGYRFVERKEPSDG